MPHNVSLQRDLTTQHIYCGHCRHRYLASQAATWSAVEEKSAHQFRLYLHCSCRISSHMQCWPCLSPGRIVSRCIEQSKGLAGVATRTLDKNVCVIEPEVRGLLECTCGRPRCAWPPARAGPCGCACGSSRSAASAARSRPAQVRPYLRQRIWAGRVRVVIELKIGQCCAMLPCKASGPT